MDKDLKKVPAKLYDLSVKCYARNIDRSVAKLNEMALIRQLPATVLVDIYLEMSMLERSILEILHNELSEINVFNRILRFGVGRQKLLHCVSTLMGNGLKIVCELAVKYLSLMSIQQALNWKNDYYDPEIEFGQTLYDGGIDSGVNIGTFLLEAGWLEESIDILRATANLIDDSKLIYPLSDITKLDCLQRLLQAQSCFSSFREANKTKKDADMLINLLIASNRNSIPNSLMANYYIKVSMMKFAQSDFRESYNYGFLAMHYINDETPARIVIDVLRHTARSCVVKRIFNQAYKLINKAIEVARKHFGTKHHVYADVLWDYGFYLLNVDQSIQSVNAYQESINIKRYIFGSCNLYVAIAQEDLAYALYVRDYSSGQFVNAKKLIDSAIDNLNALVPSNHLLIASAKRVKALILEEIALDGIMAPENAEMLLQKSEQLHKFALELSLEAFGEENVQTAKHYGNLGRLYQSMEKYKEAQEMHLRAIEIKKNLLGESDYEVGLSIGHLASLYNYHMKKYHQAEDLYLQSIAINLQLYGETYSGLEYDYRGLCHVYEATHNVSKYVEYARLLDRWRMLRAKNETTENDITPLSRLVKTVPLQDIISEFIRTMPNPQTTSAAS